MKVLVLTLFCVAVAVAIPIELYEVDPNTRLSLAHLENEQAAAEQFNDPSQLSDGARPKRFIIKKLALKSAGKLAAKILTVAGAAALAKTALETRHTYSNGWAPSIYTSYPSPSFHTSQTFGPSAISLTTYESGEKGLGHGHEHEHHDNGHSFDGLENRLGQKNSFDGHGHDIKHGNIGHEGNSVVKKNNNFGQLNGNNLKNNNNNNNNNNFGLSDGNRNSVQKNNKIGLFVKIPSAPANAFRAAPLRASHTKPTSFVCNLK